VKPKITGITGKMIGKIIHLTGWKKKIRSGKETMRLNTGKENGRISFMEVKAVTCMFLGFYILWQFLPILSLPILSISSTETHLIILQLRFISLMKVEIFI